MAVSITLDPFRPRPRKMFEFSGATYSLDQNFADYDTAPAGRFLAARGANATAGRIHVVLNWSEDVHCAPGR
jgi:hypothetical protein